MSSLGRALAVVVGLLFLLLVTGNGLAYLALHRAGIEVLQGLGDWPSLGSAWYHSLAVSTTAFHGGTVPVGSLGRVVQSFQLLNTVAFLGLALFLVTYAMGSRGREDVNRFGDYPRRLVERLDRFVAEVQALDALPPPHREVEGQGRGRKRE